MAAIMIAPYALSIASEMPYKIGQFIFHLTLLLAAFSVCFSSLGAENELKHEATLCAANEIVFFSCSLSNR